MRNKEVVLILVIVLLFTSLVVIVTKNNNVYSTTSKEAEIAKRQLEKGDTLSEVLSSFTLEQVKNDKYLSKLLEEYEEEREIDKSYEYEGENEATETKEEKEFEEREFIAEIEDDLEDAKDDYRTAQTELQKIEAKSEVERIEKLLEYYKEKLD